MQTANKCMFNITGHRENGNLNHRCHFTVWWLLLTKQKAEDRKWGLERMALTGTLQCVEHRVTIQSINPSSTHTPVKAAFSRELEGRSKPGVGGKTIKVSHSMRECHSISGRKNALASPTPGMNLEDICLVKWASYRRASIMWSTRRTRASDSHRDRGQQ